MNHKDSWDSGMFQKKAAININPPMGANMVEQWMREWKV